MANLVVRLRALRLLSCRTQKEMAELLGVAIPRVKALEAKNYRMVDDEIVAIGERYPNMLDWFILGKPIDLQKLKNSESSDERVLFSMIDNDRVPEESSRSMTFTGAV